MEHVYKVYADGFDSIRASVIMPVYNRTYCVEKAIGSVMQQTHANWELIVVDDGSTDGLKEVLKTFLDDKRIRLIEKNHGGVSEARNAGIAAANGRHVFYLDSDNVWEPGYLRTMIIFMEVGRLDAAYAGARLIDDTRAVIGYYGESFNWRECYELNYIDINCFAHRKDLLDKGFRFDEQLNRLVDWDFILALTANGKTAYAPFIGVEYYDGQKGRRITCTEYPGEDIQAIITKVQQKHIAAFRDPSTSRAVLRPSWKTILKTGEAFALSH